MPRSRQAPGESTRYETQPPWYGANNVPTQRQDGIMNSSTAEILLVEDNEDDVDLTLHVLRGQGLAGNTFVARDGEDALDFLFCRGAFTLRSSDCLPRLVLLDLKLPRANGMQVLKQIRSDPRTRALPVVMLTSSKEEQDLVTSYNLGANSYIQKPIDFDEFRSVMKLLSTYWLVVNQPPVAKSVLHVSHS
jgi:two-component system, response regulator